MKNIWKIFTKDVKQLVKQPFALIIIIGLCVIPSLYAWFNIFANWDPDPMTPLLRESRRYWHKDPSWQKY
jgi:hypothetical protein